MLHKKVIILGTRGIPANHGGFETFAEHLSLYLVQNNWQVSVYCQSEHKDSKILIKEWQNIQCIQISPFFQNRIFQGVAGTILFDLRSILHAIKHHKNSVWLVLGYNTAFLNLLPYLLKIKQVFNMDGIEWRRDKWPWFAKAYLYINYKIAGWIGKALVADNPEIEIMLHNDFNGKDITMIPYGSDPILQADTSLLDNYNLQPNNYSLLIARLEPENNILPIIKSWSAKLRTTKLVIVGNYLGDSFYLKNLRKIASKDIIFLGPIYDKEIIKTLRFHCKTYLHGHSVGGTNPTLVESLGAGNAIIAHDNPFNKWVASKAAVYFKDENDLAIIFDKIESGETDPGILKENARIQHQEKFQWLPIFKAYESLIQNQF